ncbi:MAG: hypothetical protein LDL41_14845 [Coleofasciculus sp. S288]|nr:hypothetical protein [Coleofasciculus sp. S288]
MQLPYFLKNLPPSTRLLFRPMLLISLVLHGVVLVLPASFESKPSEFSEKEETVKITKIPLVSKSSSQAFPQSSPTLIAKLPPQPPQASRLQTTDIRPTRQTNPSPIKNTRPTRQTNPSSNQSISQQSVNSDASQSQQNATTSQGSDEGTGLAEKIEDFFSIFPRYPGAKKRSGGVLRTDFDDATYLFHTEDTLETVASKFEKELLPNEKFTRPERIRDETNFKVYRVSSKSTGETKYLHLIFKDGKTAIYLESDNYSLAQLIEARTEDSGYTLFTGYIFTAINSVKLQYNLKDFDPENDINNLVATEQFRGKNFALNNARKTTAANPISVDNLVSSLKEQLQKLSELRAKPLSLEVQEGGYEGTPLYKVTDGQYDSYLIFAPTKDNQTVIILARDDPR